jgi:Flp pilus assembly protein TadD
LSTLFWMLTTAAWLRYVESKTVARYALVLALFALGLMAKPMLVTLPFTLMLFDYWPLKRATLPPLWKEKLPLFAMAFASCVVTVVAQRTGGAFVTLSGVALPARAANAAVAYVSYLGKTFWPTSLAIFYPYPKSVPVGPAIGSALLLLAVTVLAVRLAKRAPFFLFGWLWFLGTLIPVIGLVQVGAQAMADRYTYVPLIGVFVALAWGLASLVASRPAMRYAAAALAAGSIVALVPVTRAQARTFTDNASVFGHALAVTSNNFVAHANLGLDAFARGRPEEAIAHYVEALRIKPDDVEALNNLGAVYRAAGRNAEAVDQFQQALRLGPDSAGAHFNLGEALAATGRIDAAIEQFSRAVQLRPDDAAAHLSLATVLAQSGRFDAAVPEFNEALRLKPDSPEALNNLGQALAAMNRIPESIARLQEAVRLRPGFARAHNNLGASLAAANRYPEALEQFALAVQLDPTLVQARANFLGLKEALGRQR